MTGIGILQAGGGYMCIQSVLLTQGPIAGANSGARSGVAAIQQSLGAQLNRTNLQARRSGTDAIDLSS